MTAAMPAAQSRRIFLHAQGLDRRRRPGRAGPARFREYLGRQGVLQLDSVNVLARAHYMPLFSRYGNYDRAKLDNYLWSSGEAFEHWGHQASVMPRALLPALHHRMSYRDAWRSGQLQNLERERPGLLEQVRDAVEAHGPVTAADLDHLSPTGPRSTSWWDHDHVKLALEYLFFTGGAAVSGRPQFRRMYDSPSRVWGREAAQGALARDEARQQLFDRAIGAVGVGTARDVADHFRLGTKGASALADSAVDRGLAEWVEVEAWGTPALLAVGAPDPGRATGAALLSPFDPVCWYRPRLERMFGMDYKIEVYTPAPKRTFGYYTLPFLMGDQMVGRFDLKADRKAGVLRVQSSWREKGEPPGARQRADSEIAAALADELRVMATWLDLDYVAVEPRGNFAAALASVANS